MSQSLPAPVQTMYAELSERAQLGQMTEEFDPAGIFVKRTMHGRDYWYFRSPTIAGKRTDKYVGPDSPDLAEKIVRHRGEKANHKERRTLLAALIRAGLRGPDARSGRVLEALAKAGVFRLRAVLVGTVAYQTYPGLIGARLSNTNAMTEDLDLAQFRGVSIAVEDAVETPFLDILRTVDPEFRAIPPIFAAGQSSRFALGDRYRVDILTPMQGPSDDRLVPLPALKADAQPLRFLDFLIYREVKAVCLWGAGISVNVPAPERFALHKLLVSRLRVETSDSQAKATKDIRQAGELIGVLAAQRPYELRDAWEELTARGPRWRHLANQAVSLLDQATGSPAARQTLEQVVGAAA
jgi:hypothetical protein